MMYWIVNIFQLVIIFLLELSVVTGDSVTEMTNNESTEVGGRIVNGTKVTFGRFKYIVSLREKERKETFCAGSLIRDNWIITAAHCVAESSQPTWTLVAGGVLKLHPISPNRQIRYGKKWIVHPDYDSKTLHKDIALLLVDPPFEVNQYLGTITWPMIVPPPGTFCTVAGWGTVKEGNKWLSTYLLSIDVPLIEHERCRKFFGGDVEEGEICAGYVEGGTDSCSGDSGGPMECNGQLTGIVSGGWGCARPFHPGRYVDVSFHSDWINKNIIPDRNITDYDRIPNNSMTIMSLVPLIYLFLSSLITSLIEYIFLC